MEAAEVAGAQIQGGGVCWAAAFPSLAVMSITVTTSATPRPPAMVSANFAIYMG
jgi:hypothetical protein